MIDIQIVHEPFDPWERIKSCQNQHLRPGSYGALSSFVGTMRDLNLGDQVHSMHIEQYQEMAEKQMRELLVQNCSEEIEGVLLVHRVGTIHPGEPIVLVAVWSQHRHTAFALTQKIVEKLKSEIPFWKKESLPNQERWVTT